MFNGMQWPGTAVRHASVGAFCAAINLGIVYVGTGLLHSPYIFVMLATCFVTIPVGYFLHRQHSFCVKEDANSREFFRFLSQQLIQFFLGLGLLSIGVEWLGFSPTAAFVLVTFLLWIFALISQWKLVFRRRDSAKDNLL